MVWLLAGFVFGMAGSFHCVGMCGPLALVLPGSDNGKIAFILTRFLYNMGRVVTYSIIGALLGIISGWIALEGYQQALSIAVGLLLLLGLGFSAIREKLNQWKSYPAKWIRNASKPVKSLFQNYNTYSFFLIGILNGFLPCGFVYLALATALTAGTVWNSTAFMAGFGVGTIPAMLAVSMAGIFMTVSFREKMQRWSPYFIAFVGILLILRGLNLGIPHISPSL